jgi:ribosomal protein L16 Arg81 hydroxylase
MTPASYTGLAAALARRRLRDRSSTCSRPTPSASSICYWQREHLHVPARRLQPASSRPRTRDELAGLAMEDGVDARIVRHDGRRWSQERGPLRMRRTFRRPGRWSLLVHGVDRYWDEAAQLFGTWCRFCRAGASMT